MDEAQRQSTEEGQLARLLRYARPQRGPIRRAVFWSVSNKLLDLAPPGLIGMAVDIVVSRETSLLARWGVRAVEDQLWILAGLTVLIWGLESVTEYLLKWEWQRIAQRLQRSLRGDCYAHLHGLSSAWFSARSPGELLATLNDDVNQLERFLNGGANALLQLATTALTVSAVFFFFSPLVASLAALPIPIILWGSFAFQRRIAPRYHEVRARSAAIAQRLSDTLSGVEVVKSFTAESREVEALDVLSGDYEEANQRAINLSAAFSPLIRMAIVIGFTATLVIGGRLALAGELEVGAYGMLVFLTQRLLWPLTSLGATFDLYQRAMASAGRAFAILDETPDLIGGDRALTRNEAAIGTIKLERVHFAYPKRAPVLQDFSLEIAAQRCTAIVGPTGSGKSTIARLIARLYDPQEGSITLDQQPLPSFDLGALRRAVGVVSQQVYLFDGTIRENLLYGRPEASEAELIEAAKRAEAHAFISALPQGYDTSIGDRGLQLSGGQRQRLSLARVILKDPPIMILDEATSAVDNETEAAIQRSLKTVSAGRTTVVIAHRLSTIREADRIVVLEAGRLVEEGQHSALLEAGGLYARLWQAQRDLD